ncbi:MAG: 1-acyl-sn-glycerol-3-phosphate acyltransferase [Clostridiales bacterium]|nr:1-acyl-sn-glycerol-3-phosphate acyltransferase [Clostridiales bacterium]
MRTLLVSLFLLAFFIISIPLYLVALIIGLFSLEKRAIWSQKVISFVSKAILFLSGVKLTVIGLDNIPKDEAVLFVFNHRSYYDILTCYASMSKKAAFIAKKELKYFPFINIWMVFINCLFLDREDIRQGLNVILKGIEMIKNGYSIFIAPEGTRNLEEEMLPFKEGSLKMAQKTGCPIIPVSINNADNIFEQHVPWVKKGHIIVEYCKPVYPKELDKEDQKQLGKYVRSIIKETLDKNKGSLEF